MTDIPTIRKLAAKALGERALAELTSEPDDSLDQVLLYKAAQAEDRPLFEYCQRLPGFAIHNYEALGGTFKSAASMDWASKKVVDAAKGVLQRTGKKPHILKLHETIEASRKLSPSSLGSGARTTSQSSRGAISGAIKDLREEAKQAAAEEDEVLKQAFGTPMFASTPAPDPKLEAEAALRSPSASSGPAAPQAPSPSSGPQGGGGPSGAGAPKVQSTSGPTAPGTGAVGDMG